jgi:hypothetical protein
MSSNFGEIVKKLILCLGKSPPEGYPSHPLPPARHLDLATLTRGGKHQIESPSAKSGHPNETPEWGENSAFLK